MRSSQSKIVGISVLISTSLTLLSPSTESAIWF